MADFIGYNPQEINSLLDVVSKSYNTLGSNIAEGWSSVSNTMQQNWKGTDEQDFEAKLADRMCKLYDNCTELVKATMTTIEGLGRSWVEFQNTNRLQGGDSTVSVANSEITFEIPTIEPYDMRSTVKLAENTFAGENLGLVNGGGATINSSVTAYTEDIKSKVKNLYDQIDSSKAFLGDQSASINEFLAAVGSAVQALATDVADMQEALGTLTDTGYSSADQESVVAAQQNATKASELAGKANAQN